MRKRVEGKEREVFNGDFVSLREVVLEDENVAAASKCGADEFEANV